MDPCTGFESKKAYLSAFSLEAYVSGALTGIIEVSDNKIDLAIDPNVPSGVYTSNLFQSTPPGIPLEKASLRVSQPVLQL